MPRQDPAKTLLCQKIDQPPPRTAVEKGVSEGGSIYRRHTPPIYTHHTPYRATPLFEDVGGVDHFSGTAGHARDLGGTFGGVRVGVVAGHVSEVFS